MLSSQPRLKAPGAASILPVAASGDRLPILRQYLRIALRWRYVIIGAVVSCILLGTVVTLLMTPKYTATATIEISREADKVTNIPGVDREASVADQEFYQTQYGLLQSRSLSERVARQLRLVDDPKFYQMFGATSNDPAFQLVNGRYPVSGQAIRQRAAGEILLKRLNVDPTRLSRLVDLHFTSPNPDFSARIANSWAENFIETNLERKIQATSYGRNLLQRQLADYKQRLDASQRQLVGYASAEQIINLPSQTASDNRTTSERSIVADDLAALNTALSQATADRIQAEARYEQAGRAGASTEALRNVAINNLRQQLNAPWPFLYDEARIVQKDLDIREYTDTEHDIMIPHTLLLRPGLVVERVWNGYWYWGRPSMAELHDVLRKVTRDIRPDWDITTPAMRAQWSRGEKDAFFPYGRKDMTQVLREMAGAVDQYARPADPEAGRA